MREDDLKWRQVAPLSNAEWRQLIAAVERRWRAGETTGRLMSALRTQTVLTAFSGRVPLGLEWTDALLDHHSWVCDPFVQVLRWGEAAGTSADLGLHAAITFASLQCLQVSDTPPWFNLSESLAYSLIGTRLRGVRPADVALPFPGLYIELPRDMLYVHHEWTGMHEARVICLAEGSPSEHSALVSTQLAMKDLNLTLDDLRKHPEYNARVQMTFGRRLLIMCYCDANQHSRSPEDDNITYCSLPLGDDSCSIEDLLALDDEVSGTDPQGGEIGAALLGHEMTRDEMRNLLRSFAVNFLMYLSSPELDKVHSHEKRIQALQKKKKNRRVRDQIQRLRAKPEWDIGSRVVVTPGLREAVSRSTVAGGRQVATNILVRGHWRRQWYGPKTEDKPKGQSQHWKWIAPTVRNPAPGKVFGHEYVLAEE